MFFYYKKKSTFSNTPFCFDIHKYSILQIILFFKFQHSQILHFTQNLNNCLKPFKTKWASAFSQCRRQIKTNGVSFSTKIKRSSQNPFSVAVSPSNIPDVRRKKGQRRETRSVFTWLQRRRSNIRNKQTTLRNTERD